MKKNQTVERVEPLSLNSSWEEMPIMSWLMRYGRHLFIALIALIVLLVGIYWANQRGERSAEHDYLKADKLFQTFAIAKADPDEAKNALNELAKLLKKHPDLAAKYEGLMVQVLLNRGEVEEALKYAVPALTRTAKENEPFYATYSKVALLIAKGKDQEALDHSLTLHQNLKDAKDSTYETLIAYNLIRIAALQQRLQLASAELATWNEWQALVTTSPELKQMIAELKEGSVSFNQFVEERIRQLKLLNGTDIK